LIAFAGTAAAQAQTSPTPAPSPAASPAPAASPSPTASPSPPPHLIQFSGFADAAYSSHVGNGTSKFVNNYPSRVFDYNDRTPDLQNLNVNAALNAGNLTGKLELSAGTDADIIQSYPGAFNSFDVTQAYLAYQLGHLSVQGGKFETLAGAEVIEYPGNLNFSRSILFGFAIPFTHTGGRLTYALTPHLNVIGGVNAGWDEVRSINGRLTGEYGLAFTPSSALTFNAQGYTGIEQLSNYVNPYSPYISGTPNQTATSQAITPGGLPVTLPAIIPPCIDGVARCAQGQRSLIDLAGTVHPTTATTFTLNYDRGLQHNASLGDADGAATAGWSGLAGYLGYNFTPKLSIAGRYEGFHDTDGYRTGFVQFWREGTGTVSYNLTSALTLRAEYRHDVSDHDVFLNADGTTFGHQNSTVSLDGLVKF
jgi:hypothetical protein